MANQLQLVQNHFNTEPRSRAGILQVRVVQLRCPYIDYGPNQCRAVFVNGERGSNHLVRQQLSAHLVTVHGFGPYVCFYGRCDRPLRDRVFFNEADFWTHIRVHREHDAAQLRANVLYNMATYVCMFCSGGQVVRTTSQAAMHVHIAQRHHPGTFQCNRANCDYTAYEQYTAVQHCRNPRHR